ncbi:tRNA (cytosine(38)-C(5))-methyltransferase-like isoform X2 [Corticium candelabrum]|uniref:tRNA (cytosine(38)-C(5))-methyltransferase-like isoform X2 n=1 Tax=Corticium candelabrum TaxID=121492 RepID=UPI002E27320A|nr:tRNA (cytosine(38)-C(5))-methyltransferase-like isoform X2 [Corticium candelabrum]
MSCSNRVLELYSGVGGMHWAMKGCGVSFNVVGAIDINTTANHVYRHNFLETSILQRNIESLSVDEFHRMNVEILLASPPCQPFTRLPTPPTYILIENVKGFEESETRERLITTLHQCHYTFQEFLLTPVQFGIPNSRLRYYIVAVHLPRTLPFEPIQEVQTTMPTGCRSSNVHAVGDYLERLPESEVQDYLLSSQTLNRFGKILDIVTASSRRSCCFTKAYSHYVEGTGSVLQTTHVDMHSVFAQFSLEKAGCAKAEAQIDRQDDDCPLLSLGLRYFTPREVANLLCFPSQFEFPDGLSNKQKYRLLGNSLNVHVVTELIRTCFFHSTVQLVLHEYCYLIREHRLTSNGEYKLSLKSICTQKAVLMCVT